VAQGVDNRRNAVIRQLLVPVLATLAGLLVGALFILAAGKDPMQALQYAADYVAGTPAKFGETLVSSIPLVFTGLAVMLAFRCGLFNIVPSKRKLHTKNPLKDNLSINQKALG
jgi:ABC-type uncharacterized transport system permease subunit